MDVKRIRNKNTSAQRTYLSEQKNPSHAMSEIHSNTVMNVVVGALLGAALMSTVMPARIESNGLCVAQTQIVPLISQTSYKPFRFGVQT